MEQQQQQQQKKKKQHQNPPPSHLIASFSSCDPYPAPSSYPYPAHPPPPPPPPAPPVHSSLYYYSGGYSAGNYGNPMAGRANFAPYHAYHSLGWSAPGIRPPPPMTGSLLPPPPPYVEHQQAKKVRNDVNVHKDTLRLEVDEQNSDHHLISFVFDALFDGRTGWG